MSSARNELWSCWHETTLGNLRTTTTTLSTTTGSELQCMAQATSKFRRRGLVDDAK